MKSKSVAKISQSAGVAGDNGAAPRPALTVGIFVSYGKDRGYVPFSAQEFSRMQRGARKLGISVPRLCTLAGEEACKKDGAFTAGAILGGRSGQRWQPRTV